MRFWPLAPPPFSRKINRDSSSVHVRVEIQYPLNKMLESSHKSSRGDMLGKGGDNGIKTVECLRGRLLAERVASKAAKNEADLMARRLEELERHLAEEIKSRNRAEKRLKYALKKLESLKVLDVSGQSNASEGSASSSSSSALFLGHQRSTGWKPGSGKANSGQCDSGGEVEEMARVTGSKELLGDDASGNSSQEGSWSSAGTAHSRNKEAPLRGEDSSGVGRQESVTDAVSQSSLNGDEPDSAAHQGKHSDNTLALVPASMAPTSGACCPEINNNVQGVLVALRHVREQLQNSMARRAVAVSSPKEPYGQ